jgi:hypothetical protein
VAFSQVNQTIVHSSIANRHNQNSSLEGRWFSVEMYFLSQKFPVAVLCGMILCK